MPDPRIMASGPRWAARLARARATGVKRQPGRPTYHPSRFMRSLGSLTGRIECGKCLLPIADVVAMALTRGKRGPTDHMRLVVEAVCPTCGYQTVYFADK